MTDPTFQVGLNDVCLLWKGDQFFREKNPYLKRCDISCKKFQRVHREPFFDKFSVFRAVLVLAKLLLLMTVLLSEFLKMNCASFERVTNFLEKSFFTRNDLVSAAKGSKHCTPNHFFEKFSVFWAILVQAKLSLFMSDATVRIGSNELCLLWKGGQLLRKKAFYLKRSGISCKKFQSVHHQTFLDKFWFFLENVA